MPPSLRMLSLTCASTPVISVSSELKTRSRGSSTLKSSAHSREAPKVPLITARKKDDRSHQSAVMMEQITSPAEPTEKRRDRKAVQRRQAMRAMVPMGRLSNMKVPKMSPKMPKVQMSETAERSRQAKDKTDSEADKIEGFHGHWVRRFTGLPAPAGL